MVKFSIPSKKKLFLISVALVLVVALILSCAPAAPAETIELAFSSPWPPPAGGTKAFAKFAEQIETETNGRVKVNFYPGGALGKAPEQYDLVVAGTADAAQMTVGYTPGRFPLAEGFDLPLIYPQEATAEGLVFQELYEKYSEMQAEFSDVKHLAWAGIGGRHIHTVKKPIHTLADFKGLKFRAKGPIEAETLNALGAVPVDVDIAEVYTALERGTIDGVLFEWEGFKAFKLNEVAKYTTLIGLNSTGHLVVMNRNKYESLPSDVRKAIDKVSGSALTKTYGGILDSMGMTAEKAIKEAGQEIYELPPAERDRWTQAVTPVLDKWAADMEAKGLPGKKIIEAARELSKKYAK